jgi:hypothetical protein
MRLSKADRVDLADLIMHTEKRYPLKIKFKTTEYTISTAAGLGMFMQRAGLRQEIQPKTWAYYTGLAKEKGLRRVKPYKPKPLSWQSSGSAGLDAYERKKRLVDQFIARCHSLDYGLAELFPDEHDREIIWGYIQRLRRKAESAKASMRLEMTRAKTHD